MVRKFIATLAAVLCTAAVMPLCASADKIFDENFAYENGYDLLSLDYIAANLNNGTVSASAVDDAGAVDGKAMKISVDSTESCNLAVVFPEKWNTNDGSMTMEIRMKLDSGINAAFQTLGQLYGAAADGTEMKSWGLYAWTNDPRFVFLEKGGGNVFGGVKRDDILDKYVTIVYAVDTEKKTFSFVLLKEDGTTAFEKNSVSIDRAPYIIKELRFCANGKADIYIDYIKFTQEKYPKIISSSVNDGDINLPERPEIKLYFDMPIKAESINKTNFRIIDKSGTAISEDMYDLSYARTESGEYEVKVNVAADLVNGETYTLAVSGVAADSETERIMKETKEISFTVIKYFNIDNIEITDNDGILTVNVDYSATVSDVAEKPYYIIASLLCEENGKFRIYKSAFDAGIFSAGNNSKAMTAQFEKPAAEKCFVNIMLWDSMNNSKSYIKSVQKEFGLR